VSVDDGKAAKLFHVEVEKMFGERERQHRQECLCHIFRG
jgi:hypothetical protein